VSSTLVIAYGNPGRLDDGLGPAMAEILERLRLRGVRVESNYQLTVEDAATISLHDAVVFVDAAASGPEPFSFRRIAATSSLGFTSHRVEPEALLGLSRDLFGADVPGFVLGIRGYAFDEFGEHLSAGAELNLAAASQFLATILRQGDPARIRADALSRSSAPGTTGEGDEWEAKGTSESE
jgi:hydrogenase maturation protease